MIYRPTRSVFYDMLRSFVSLARTLNLSRTVKELESTRQTVRRHIATLEELRREKLFEVVDRQYGLTEGGRMALREAEDLLTRADIWIDGHSNSVNGLAHISFNDEQDYYFYAQQHPLMSVWKKSPKLIQKGLKAWALSQGRLDHRSMRSISPYLVTYRSVPGGWMCVDIGKKSSYATWIGMDWAASAIGFFLDDDPISVDADRFVKQAYREAFEGGGLRLDHVVTKVSRKEGGKLEPVSYQRLLMACVFPNKEQVLSTLVARTQMIDIFDLPKEVSLSPLSDLMEFDV